MIDALYEMLHPETLPLCKDGRMAHYEGSIDKTGKNDDWEWHLYQDERDEWVIFEQFGAGCIYNFVQHHFMDAEQPVFRFYFDGEDLPRFTIDHSQFGEKYPFIEPLASRFIGPIVQGQGEAIRVVRSFVPMPFTAHCKITSSIRLETNTTGGWGHVIYHTYSVDKPVESFRPDDPRYLELSCLWNQVGRAPVQPQDKYMQSLKPFNLSAGESIAVYDDEGAGLITAIRMRTDSFSRDNLNDLWVTARWDGHSANDIELPFGCLFANELGFHKVSYLYAGMDSDGGYECFFPMPYGKSAEIKIENRGVRDIYFCMAQITRTRQYNELYKNAQWGYFRNSPYYEKRCTVGSDSMIAAVHGQSGHIVGSVITGYPFEEGGRADCEGDVRIHFDGIRTPQIESDGSESYACYGWGFAEPPQCCAASGYDGQEYDVHRNWSMCRLLPGDFYNFRDGFDFGIESFGWNNEKMYHSGAVLYYGKGASTMKKIAEYRKGTESLSAYFEGDKDDELLTFSGSRAEEILFNVDMQNAKSLMMRRVSDQNLPRQLASVYIDGTLCPDKWYNPDHNPYLRWLEDEYIIPSTFIADKKSVEIHIVPEECAGTVAFNQFGIDIYALY